MVGISARKEPQARKQRRRTQQYLIYLTIGVLAFVLGIIVGRSTAPRSLSGVVLESAEDVQRISVADARTLIDAGKAVLLDVRSRDAYETKHAAGATAFPEDEFGALVDGLPRDRKLIFYCT